MSNIVLGPLALIFRINIFTQKAQCLSLGVWRALSLSIYLSLYCKELRVCLLLLVVPRLSLLYCESTKQTTRPKNCPTNWQLVCKNVIHLNCSSSTNKANENNMANDKEKDDDKDNGMPHQRIRTMYSQMSCTRKTQATNNNNQNNITLTTNETTSRATNKPNERTNERTIVFLFPIWETDGRTNE